MLAFRQTWAILKKDLILELRTREMLLSMFLFVLLTMVIFNSAFDAERTDLTTFGGGLLWLAFIFTSFLGLNRSVVHEKDEGCLDGLLLSPVDRSLIYVGKMLGNLIFISLVEVVAIPIFTIFFIKFPYYVYPQNLSLFLAGVFLANIGIAGVGTFVATLAANTKRRDLLTPILGLPMLMPVLGAAVSISGATMGGQLLVKTLNQAKEAMQILLFYDIVFLVAIALLYEVALGE